MYVYVSVAFYVCLCFVSFYFEDHKYEIFRMYLY